MTVKSIAINGSGGSLSRSRKKSNASRKRSNSASPNESNNTSRKRSNNASRKPSNNASGIAAIKAYGDLRTAIRFLDKDKTKEAITLIKARKENLNLQDHDGKTLLMHAIEFGKKKLPKHSLMQEWI